MTAQIIDGRKIADEILNNKKRRCRIGAKA